MVSKGQLVPDIKKRNLLLKWAYLEDKDNQEFDEGLVKLLSKSNNNLSIDKIKLWALCDDG